LASRLVTITSPGPLPKRRTCALISFSTHSSAGIVRVDAYLVFLPVNGVADGLDTFRTIQVIDKDNFLSHCFLRPTL
jgi:hypothetical protein